MHAADDDASIFPRSRERLPGARLKAIRDRLKFPIQLLHSVEFEVTIEAHAAGDRRP
jgi:hypothetical protein